MCGFGTGRPTGRVARLSGPALASRPRPGRRSARSLFWTTGSTVARPNFRDARVIAAPSSAPLRAMAAYWESKRGGRVAPRRAQIDPAEITAHMPNLLMVDVLPDDDYRYR